MKPLTRRVRVLWLACTLLLLAGMRAAAQEASGSDAAAPSRMRSAPTDLVFEENRGQWETDATYVLRGRGATLHFDARGFGVQLLDSGLGGRPVDGPIRFEFEGASPVTRLIATDQAPGVRHYFLGSDPQWWRRDVPAWRTLRYEGMHPGVGVEFRAGDRGLEARVTLNDGIDAAAVRLTAASAAGLADGRFEFESSGLERVIPSTIGFGLEWSTYLGGSSRDQVMAVATTADGYAIIGGTDSADYPITADAVDPIYDASGGCLGGGAGCEVFVTHIDKQGGLIWSTFLGGASFERATTIQVGPGGDLFLCGISTSDDFPTTPGAFAEAKLPFGPDAFVTRLLQDGSDLVYSTYLGGSLNEDATGIAVTATGEATVVGTTSSPDYPVTSGAFDAVIESSGSDAFITRFTLDGSALVFSTFLGGAEGESGLGIALDQASGNLVVVGSTRSPDFPFSPGAFQPGSPGATSTGFVARMDAGGTRVIQATSLGGSFNSVPVKSVVIAPAGDVIVAGETYATDFPVTEGAFQTTFHSGNREGFVTRFDPTLSRLVYSTLLGGGRNEQVDDLHVDSAGIVTVSGWTDSDSFPTTTGAYAETKAGVLTKDDLFVSRLSAAGDTLYYSTYLGGTGDDNFFGSAVANSAVSSTGEVVIAGTSMSTDFPVTAGALQPTLSGDTDGVVAKLSMLPTGVKRYGASTAGCTGALPIGVTAMPQVGAAFGIYCTNLNVLHARGLLVVTSGALDPPRTLHGVDIWVDLSTHLARVPAFGNEVGFAQVTLELPDRPALVGLQVFAQYFFKDACAEGGWSASNALSLELQSATGR